MNAVVVAAACTFALSLTLASAPAQQDGKPAIAGPSAKAPVAYPERDILTPFRNPDEIAAPPDELFGHLRTMRRIADDPAAQRSFDAEGREIVDDETWRTSRRAAEHLGIDAGVLAGLMRTCRNPDLRDVAFYAGFFCQNVDYVFNLISHIPGEPERRIRERAYPRAIAFLRVHVGRTFGDLSPEEQQSVTAQLPKIGSPEANSRGITRLPRPDDRLFTINLKPFFQLLDLDDPLDQAQGLWFLKETFPRRRDLAVAWLEPALPRVRQLLLQDDVRVRREAIGVFAAIAPELAPPPIDADARLLDAFADQASHAMFPPIRRVSDGLFLLLPGAERDALSAAGKDALAGNRIGEATHGKTADGIYYRGLRVDRVPDELAVFAIPAGAIILSVNGTPVDDGPSLVKAISAQFVVREIKDKQSVQRHVSTARLVVEFLVDGQARAIEYRVM